MGNAHATSTPIVTKTNYAQSATCSTSDSEVLVSSTKGHTGHTLGAAGGIEAVYTVMALNQKCAPQNLNLETPIQCDSEKVRLVSAPTTIPVERKPYAISNSFGFSGTNCSLLFKSLRAIRKSKK